MDSYHTRPASLYNIHHAFHDFIALFFLLLPKKRALLCSQEFSPFSLQLLRLFSPLSWWPQGYLDVFSGKLQKQACLCVFSAGWWTMEQMRFDDGGVTRMIDARL